MQLPPFTWKSCLLFMVGVVAALLGIYFLVAALYHMQPHNQIPPPQVPASSMVVAPWVRSLG